MAVAAVGAIVENRFDIAVALAITLAVLFLARKQVVLAAAVIGFGFALKLTPAVFLPLALTISFALVMSFLVSRTVTPLPMGIGSSAMRCMSARKSVPMYSK